MKGRNRKKEYLKNRNEIVKKSEGITLVALVVTIVIMIILATVSISAVFGENGLITKAKEVSDKQSNVIRTEEEELNRVTAEYTNIMSTDGTTSGGGLGDTEPVDKTAPLDETLIKNPKIVDGMTPVKYVKGIGWIKTTNTDSEWYNYGSGTEEKNGLMWYWERHNLYK